MSDKVAKGRQSRGKKHSDAKLPTAARGESHGHSKLTNELVLQMRDLRAKGALLKELGPMFGVRLSTVQKIVTGKAWTHVK